jgi:hypothetical protein
MSEVKSRPLLSGRRRLHILRLSVACRAGGRQARQACSFTIFNNVLWETRFRDMEGVLMVRKMLTVRIRMENNGAGMLD